MTKKLCFIFGTRPEAIKIAPVIAELREREIWPQLVCTGQHTDLLKGTPVDTDLAHAISLEIASDGNVTRYVNRAKGAIKRFLMKDMPSMVVVQGDTMSALAGAQAAESLDIEIAHIEAGVRSHAQEPWPEEHTRVNIDMIASRYYAPTEHARSNLLGEDVPYRDIRVTGNTAVSALARYTNARPSPEKGATILVTLHRRELRVRDRARKVIDQLFNMARDLPHIAFFWPVHPAMRGYIPETPPANFVLSGPVSYKQNVEGLAECRGVLTDSGGLVEESATLGVPCAILRNVNDRPEAVDAGVARLFAPTPKGVVDAVTCLVERKLPRVPSNCFGNATAAQNIAKELIG